MTDASDTLWAEGTWNGYSGLEAIIQEIVDRPSWASGNSLSLILQGVSESPWGRKFVTSYDGDPALAPRLVITYLAVVEPQNQNPVAVIAEPLADQVFTADSSGNASVLLSPTGSNDPDGSIVAFDWSWTGAASGSATGGAQMLDFGVGSYALTLTVTDDDGATGSASVNFSVQAATPGNQNPVAVIASPTNAQVFTADSSGNASVLLDASGSTDSDGTIVNYAWNWTGTTSGSASDLVSAQSFGVGSYTLTLTVTDDDGATGGAVVNFQVDPEVVDPPVDNPPTFAPPPALNNLGGDSVTLDLAPYASDDNSAALAFNLVGGTLPTGLTMSPVGLITGTIGGSAAMYTPTIQVMDSIGQFVEATITWTVTEPVDPDPAETFPVNASSNEDGSFFLANAPQLFVGTGASTTNSLLGLRFNNISIPQGATIQSAAVEFYTPTSQWITVNIAINGEAASNSVTFSGGNRPSSRTLTTAQVTSNSNVSWAANTWNAYGGLEAIVQEIVNRSDWSSGSSLSLIIRGTGPGQWGRKFITSYEGNPAFAPRLVIEYSAPAPLVAPISVPETTPVETSVPPSAGFTSDVVSGNTPLTVQFFNQSSGDIAGYAWDFGDGSASTEVSPSHTYTAAGSYTVALLALGVDGTSSMATAVITVTDPAPPPVDETTSLTEEVPAEPPLEESLTVEEPPAG